MHQILMSFISEDIMTLLASTNVKEEKQHLLWRIHIWSIVFASKHIQMCLIIGNCRKTTRTLSACLGTNLSGSSCLTTPPLPVEEGRSSLFQLSMSGTTSTLNVCNTVLHIAVKFKMLASFPSSTPKCLGTRLCNVVIDLLSDGHLYI